MDPKAARKATLVIKPQPFDFGELPDRFNEEHMTDLCEGCAEEMISIFKNVPILPSAA